MKICILTQPLQTNYGGLLQAYALQSVLEGLGHEVWVEDRRSNKLTFCARILRDLKKKIGAILGHYYPTKQEIGIIREHITAFVEEQIHTTIPIYSINKTDLLEYGFDAYVVGSDQVWRPCYSFGIENYFLDFCRGLNVKRVAYAASFGVDNWEFTPEQTKVCAELLKLFDGVSVREESAINLCEKYFKIKPSRVLDPTLLLDKSVYEKIAVTGENIGDGILTYILDYTQEKKDIIDYLTGILKMPTFSVLSRKNIYKDGPSAIKDCILPSVATWLRAFMSAKFVITDSFHGTVFSIIFNKPFICIGNFKRGNTRFESLLSIFSLENRYVLSVEDCLLKQQNIEYIEYTNINRMLVEEKRKSIDFISKHL